jgi:hypothetical protein
MDPRIRICTKMSWIRITVTENPYLCVGRQVGHFSAADPLEFTGLTAPVLHLLTQLLHMKSYQNQSHLRHEYIA